MLKKLIGMVVSHKLMSGIITIVIIISSYFGIQALAGSGSQTRYVLAAAQKATIVSTISGTGQVSASSQLEIKSSLSSKISELPIVEGQQIKAGDLLVQFDLREAQSSINDAQAGLESAQIALEKAQRGFLPEELAITKAKVTDAEKDLATAEKDLTTAQVKAETDMADTYDDARSSLEDAYNKIDDILNRQLDPIFKNNRTDSTDLSFLTADSQAENQALWYRSQARTALSDLKKYVSSPPANNNIESALGDAKGKIMIVQSFLEYLSQAVNSGITSSDFSASTLSSYKNTVNSARSSATALISTINGQKQNLINQKNNNNESISSAQNKIEDAKSTLSSAQRQLALEESGADPLDLKSLQLSVRQRQNALADARRKLEDYSIKAPFDGVVTGLEVKKGDEVSASTIIATLMTKQQLAELSLTEVDAAKVKSGQKATLTFDAIEDLSITGSVAVVDAIGAASQGVVSYGAKIALDTQDDRIKPGMSVSATIIIESKADVLTVANSAVKSSGSSNYVLVLESPVSNSSQGVISATAPIQKEVEIGVADDTNTEILSGIVEGDQVVTKTVTEKKSTASAPSLLQSMGLGGRTTNKSNSTQSSGTTRSSGSSGMTAPPGGF